jgi:hypothetical protein
MGDPWAGFAWFLEILDRAHRSGQLRADFGEGDVAFLLWSIGRTIEATGAHAPQAPPPTAAASGRGGAGHAHARRPTGRLDI